MLEFIKMVLGSDVKRDEEGATAVEYGLMVFLIAVAIIGTVTILGQALDGIFQQVVAAL